MQKNHAYSSEYDMNEMSDSRSDPSDLNSSRRKQNYSESNTPSSRRQYSENDGLSLPISDPYGQSELTRRYQGQRGLTPVDYQQVAVESAPPSPVLGSCSDPDRRSNESGSGSSGAKHDQSKDQSMDTMSSDESYNERSRRTVTSDSEHLRYNDTVLYQPKPFSDRREREGSFGQQSSSGLTSGGASTVGDHQPHYSSSRTALNNDWRTSTDAGSEIRSYTVDEIAPGKEQYGRADQYTLESEKGMLQQDYSVIPPDSPSILKKERFGLDDIKAIPYDALTTPPTVIINRVNRLAWVDGLRGIASVIIFTHHFADLTWSQLYPGVLQVGGIEGFMRNGQLGIGLYFLLGGRVLAASFLKSAFTVPKAPVVHGDVETEKPAPILRPAGPRWLSLSSSLFRRSIRLAFPAIIVGFIQWQCAVHGLLDTAMMAEELVLTPSSLWAPAWGSIGNFAGFLQFCLDLFTGRNHQYILTVGSALWITYDQFWGSVLVYIVAATFAPLPARGRYSLYAIICVSLWWINSPNMLYMIGLLLADLHASGFIRKIQDSWKLTVGLEVCAMALALALISGGEKIANPANEFFARFTVYDGQFGWDPNLIWPQYMLFSNWLPASLIVFWVEISHAMQWFASWGIFTWVGKVSYGFYLLQFLTIYGLMPHLVLYFNSLGKSYWNIIIPTYIICLLFNFFVAWVSYYVLDRLGLKLGKWIWDGLFVSKPNNAAALPMKMLRHLGHVIVHGPGQIARNIASGTSSKYYGARKNIHTFFNWRTPTTRPAVPDPTDPQVLAQLHSTHWTTDLSQDMEAVRTARLLQLQSWAWLPHLFLIPGLTFVWAWYHPTGQWTYDVLTFSTFWRFLWVLSLPNCLFAWFGFITPDSLPSKEVMDQRPVHREYIRNFFIVLVTKGSNETAVRRGYNKLLKLEKYHPSVKVVVLTDEPYVYPDLQNIVCPKSYKSPLGKAKYKARALDYFRYHVSLGVYDWILHMDEESVTDGESLRHCLEFIRYTPHHFGQGIILYNGEGFWDNWYFTVADGIRVGDDLARFHFQNSVVHRPVFGVHGSFLMTNGEMENECTWDFGSLAEDFEFSQDAWRRGFTSGRIHGIVREQSPTTFRDFLKQRRRWFIGIRDIKGLYGLPNLAINLWIVGVFTLAVTIINLPLGIINPSLTPLWVAIIADFCFITFFTLYLWGLLFQELDHGQVWWKIPIHLLCAIPIQPFTSVAEGLSAIWAMSTEDFGTFEVIVKR